MNTAWFVSSLPCYQKRATVSRLIPQGPTPTSLPLGAARLETIQQLRSDLSGVVAHFQDIPREAPFLTSCPGVIPPTPTQMDLCKQQDATAVPVCDFQG